MDTTQQILEMMSQVQNETREYTFYFVAWGRFFGALGSLYMILLVYRQMMSAQQFVWDPIIRILVVFFFLIFYPSIMGFVDNIFRGMGDIVHEQSLAVGETDYISNLKTYYYQNEEELSQNLKEVNEKKPTTDTATEKYVQTVANETNTSLWDDIVDTAEKTWRYLGSLSEVLMYAINELQNVIIISILQWACTVAFMVLLGLRVFFLTVLYLLGPFAIGFSLFPGFEDTIVNWGARYIKTSLWLPVGFLLEGVMSMVTRMLLETMDQTGAGTTVFLFNSKASLLGLIFIVSLIGYFMIPKIAGWVINASGIGAAASQLRRNAKTLGNYTQKGIEKGFKVLKNRK